MQFLQQERERKSIYLCSKSGWDQAARSSINAEINRQPKIGFSPFSLRRRRRFCRMAFLDDFLWLLLLAGWLADVVKAERSFIVAVEKGKS